MSIEPQFLTAWEREDHERQKRGQPPLGPMDVNSREAAIWSENMRLKSEIEQLRNFAGWVESWVHNPVGSYSVAALDGLFGMTRDRLAMLPKQS